MRAALGVEFGIRGATRGLARSPYLFRRVGARRGYFPSRERFSGHCVFAYRIGSRRHDGVEHLPTYRSGMNTSTFPVLIETKLAPALPTAPWIARSRLIDTLTEWPDQQATSLCAPAGYGKTVLMSQAYAHLQAAGARVGWASFDRHDTTPVDFLRYVMAALRRASPDAGAQFFRLLDERAGADLDFYLDVTLSEVAAQSERVTLFLDDLHYACCDSANTLPEILEALIRYSSPAIRYVFSTRDRQRLGLWQLRAEGRLRWIDAGALAFDAQETFDYFAAGIPHALRNDQIEAIHRATEGWGMGLQLARLALAPSADVPGTLSSFSGRNRDITGYLLQNVLDAQPEAVQSFLLRTSMLDRMCAENCDALLYTDDSGKTLAYLEHANLFVVALDAEGTWYRYHHLFQEFLQRQLRLRQPGDVTGLEHRASLWFREHGFAQEALDLARSTGDVQFIAQTLAATCDTLAYTGNHSTFRATVQTIPQSILVDFPLLALDHVWVELMNWNFREARHLLSLVDNAAGSVAVEANERFAEALAHRHLMMAFHCGEFARAAELSETWLERHALGERFVIGSVYIVLMLSRAYLMDNAGLATVADKAREFYQRDNRRNALVWHNCITGLTFESRGELDAALKAYNEAMFLSKHLVGAPAGVLAMPAVFTAQVYYERNALDKARWLIDANPACDRPGGLTEYVMAYVLTRTRLHMTAGDHAAAATALDEGLDFAASYDLPHLKRTFVAEQVHQLLFVGQVEQARLIALRDGLLPASPPSPGPALTVWDASAVMTWGRIMLATGQFRVALPVLRRWMEHCAAHRSHRLAVQFALLTARARTLSGDVSGALRTLAPAIKHGAHFGLVRTFLDEGSSIRPLLVKLYETDGMVDATEKSYIRELLSALAWRAPLSDADPLATLDGGTEQLSLSGRELEILSLMSQGIKGSFVGSRLGITEGTVKWHMQRIFDKLGVRNRREAVDRARALGMLRQ